MQKVCRRYAVQKTLLLVHIWSSHTLSLFQTNIKPLNPNEENPKHFVETVFPPSATFVLRRPFFGIFSSPPTHTVETTYIHAHSAKPILNQNNQTNLTRYVSLSRVSSYPIRSPTATLYQKKPTRVLGDFWKFVLPKPIDQIVVVLSHQPLVIY